MRMQLNSLILAAFGLASLGGCIVQREVVREDPQASLPAPPPPPSDEVDAQPSGPVAAPEPAGGEVDEQVFVDRLSPYGHWEYVPDYGRWGFMAGVGWFWVPGRIWGPAWVSWRYGGGYYAWAPLGPRGYVYGYSSPAWVAVRQEHFTQPIVRYAVADVRQTTPIVQRAQALPAPRGRPAPGVHFGPPVASVAAATGQPIHPVKAAAVVPRSAPAAAPSSAAVGGRSGGAAPPARPAPSEGTPRAHPSTPSAAPSSSAPSRTESGSSGRSQPQSSPPSNSTPRAAPAHGGSGGSYRIRTGEGGASVGPAPSGGGRYGGGPAPRASSSSGRGTAARRSNNHSH